MKSNSKFTKNNRRLLNSSHAQVWQFDFAVAILIFTATIFITYQNLKPVQNAESMDDLSSQAFHVSEMLLGEGIPSNWNLTSVGQIGLISNKTLDVRKMNDFYTMPDSLRRLKIGVDEKVHVMIINKTQNISLAGIDHVGQNITQAKQTAVTTRYTIYDGYVVQLQVTVWR